MLTRIRAGLRRASLVVREHLVTLQLRVVYRLLGKTRGVMTYLEGTLAPRLSLRFVNLRAAINAECTRVHTGLHLPTPVLGQVTPSGQYRFELAELQAWPKQEGTRTSSHFLNGTGSRDVLHDKYKGHRFVVVSAQPASEARS